MKSKRIFSEVLKELKAGAGLTWKEVAKGSGLSAPALSAYVNQKHYPHDDNLAKIARFFELTPEQLKEHEGRKLVELGGKTPEAAGSGATRQSEHEVKDDDLGLFSRPLPEAPPERVAELKRLLSFMDKAVDRSLEIAEGW